MNPPNTFSRAGRFGLLLSALCFPLSIFAQTTAFTYQGRLNDGAAPASGLYDLRFALFDADSGGAQQGNALTNAATAVSNGLFTVALDFGNQFPGADRWLEIGVMTNGGGAFATLSPRQRITSTPYAIQAANAGSADYFGGPVSAEQLPASVVTNGASGVSISGSFAGHGGGITNVDVLALNDRQSITLVGDPLLEWAAVDTFAGLVQAEIADLNLDGWGDLVISRASLGGIYCLTNHGNGVFSFSTGSISAGDNQEFVVRDFNADGRSDLAQVRLSGVTSIHGNNNAGGFNTSPADSVAFTGAGVSIAAGDLNGDGLADLAMGAYTLTNSWLVLSTNQGGLQMGNVVVLPSGNLPRSMDIADANADGRADIVVAYQNDNTVALWTNGGNLNFAVAQTVAVGAGPRFVRFADLNADGQPDVVCASSTAGSLTILTNAPLGTLTFAGVVNLNPGLDSFAVLDLNGDGRPDLAAANVSSNTLTLLTNSGTASFSPAATRPTRAGPEWVGVGHANPDGVPDVVVAESGANTAAILLQTSPVRFAGSFFGDGSQLTGLKPGLGAVDTEHLADGAVTSEKIGGVLLVAQIPDLDAAKITSGTLANARLSTSVSLLGQTIESAEITDGTIANADINAGAAIADTKLASISTPGKVADTALSANIARTNQVWLLGGNAGTTAGTHFVGTTDNQPLELRVNGQRALRLQPGSFGGPILIGGATNNTVELPLSSATIGGGSGNTIRSNATGAVIAGGDNHLVEPFSLNSVISGGANNAIGSNSWYGTIAGGLLNNIGAGAIQAVVGGGRNNTIGNSSDNSIIAGGQQNSISNQASFNVIGGGGDSNIGTSSSGNVIGGGTTHQVGDNVFNAVIGGGNQNRIAAGGSYATIPGGRQNEATNYAFAAGRRAKALHQGAFVWADSQSADFASTVTNQFSVRASGGVRLETGGAGAALDGQPLVTTTSAVGDPQLSANVALLNRASQTFTGTNVFTQRVGIGTSASTSTLRVQGAGLLGDIWLSPTTGGGNADIFLSENTSGSFGVILRHNGTNNVLEFVGVNSSEETTSPVVTIGRGNSSGMDVRNSLTVGGSVGIGTNNPVEKLHVIGNILATGTITPSSDRNLKKNFEAVDPATVLTRVTALPIQEWTYQAENDAVRHVGPMAQDFHAAFGLGANDTTIATVDADGVALAAIQGLNQKLEAKLEQKEAEIAKLKTRLEKLEQLINQQLNQNTP